MIRRIRVAFSVICVVAADFSSAAELGSKFSFDEFKNQLQSPDPVVFASDCQMANGDVAVLVFTQRGDGGDYFELRRGQTVRHEQIAIANGGFEIKGPSGLRYLGKSDGAIRTLLRSYPYFMMPAHDPDSILRVPPRGRCLEQE